MTAESLRERATMANSEYRHEGLHVLAIGDPGRPYKGSTNPALRRIHRSSSGHHAAEGRHSSVATRKRTAPQRRRSPAHMGLREAQNVHRPDRFRLGRLQRAQLRANFACEFPVFRPASRTKLKTPNRIGSSVVFLRDHKDFCSVDEDLREKMLKRGSSCHLSHGRAAFFRLRASSLATADCSSDDFATARFAWRRSSATDTMR